MAVISQAYILPHAKSWLIGTDSDAGRDWGQEEKGTTEDEMAGWHHQFDGHEFEWTLGVGDGQGGLTCWDSWGRKESDMTQRLNWTELNGMEAEWSWSGSTWSHILIAGLTHPCCSYMEDVSRQDSLQQTQSYSLLYFLSHHVLLITWWGPLTSSLMSEPLWATIRTRTGAILGWYGCYTFSVASNPGGIWIVNAASFCATYHLSSKTRPCFRA